MTRRDMLKTSAAGAAAMACPSLAAEGGKAPWPFYAFDNGLRGPTTNTLEDKCKLLADLGYDGIEYHHNPAELPKMLEQLDKHGLKMYGLYTVPMVEAPLPDWGEWIKLLKGRETRIELAIRSKKFKRSDTAADDLGVALCKTVSDACADTGPVVSIYPHTGFWTEKTEDGVRMAQKCGRKNVGTNFNLVHWQWVKGNRPIETVLKEALPHLFLVTFDGLKGDPKGRQQIRPLDDSDHDLAAFLATVKKVGYTGPVGLQCWSIKEPPPEHLKRSMDTWRKLVKPLG